MTLKKQLSDIGNEPTWSKRSITLDRLGEILNQNGWKVVQGFVTTYSDGRVTTSKNPGELLDDLRSTFDIKDSDFTLEIDYGVSHRDIGRNTHSVGIALGLQGHEEPLEEALVQYVTKEMVLAK